MCSLSLMRVTIRKVFQSCLLVEGEKQIEPDVPLKVKNWRIQTFSLHLIN